MQIIPNRNMYLGGKGVERGQKTEVSKADGELAISRGWASAVEAKGDAKKAAKGDAEVDANSEAAAGE